MLKDTTSKMFQKSNLLARFLKSGSIQNAHIRLPNSYEIRRKQRRSNSAAFIAGIGSSMRFGKGKSR